jgi:hypothetical protein
MSFTVLLLYSFMVKHFVGAPSEEYTNTGPLSIRLLESVFRRSRPGSPSKTRHKDKEPIPRKGNRL